MEDEMKKYDFKFDIDCYMTVKAEDIEEAKETFRDYIENTELTTLAQRHGDLVNKIVLYPQDIDEPRSIDVDYRGVLT